MIGLQSFPMTTIELAPAETKVNVDATLDMASVSPDYDEGVSRIRVLNKVFKNGNTATLFSFDAIAVRRLGVDGKHRLRAYLGARFVGQLNPEHHEPGLLFDEGMQLSVRPALKPDEIQDLSDAIVAGNISTAWNPADINAQTQGVEIIDNNDWLPHSPIDNGSSVSDWAGRVIASSIRLSA